MFPPFPWGQGAYQGQAVPPGSRQRLGFQGAVPQHHNSRHQDILPRPALASTSEHPIPLAPACSKVLHIQLTASAWLSLFSPGEVSASLPLPATGSQVQSGLLPACFTLPWSPSHLRAGLGCIYVCQGDRGAVAPGLSFPSCESERTLFENKGQAESTWEKGTQNKAKLEPTHLKQAPQRREKTRQAGRRKAGEGESEGGLQRGE